MKMMEKPSQPAPPPQPPSDAPLRTTLTDEEISKIDKDGLVAKFKELDKYVVFALDKKAGDKAAAEKLTLQQQEATRRENVLMMRLATKEQEMQELLAQIQELKQAQTPSAQQLQTMLIDPAVNLLFEKMKSELLETKDRLEQAQNDLSAWKFTPDSVTGKKLMAKCRTLIQENQELGKQLSQGRIAQLEAELSLQKKYSEELKGSQDEMNEFVIQLDEEVEGMQATICALQQQLKESKQHEEVESLQATISALQQQLKESNQHFDKLTNENLALKSQVEELMKQQEAALVNGMSSPVAAGVVQDVSMQDISMGEHSAPSVPVVLHNGSPDKTTKSSERTSKHDASVTLSPSSHHAEVMSPSSRMEQPRRSSRGHENVVEHTTTASQEEPMQVEVVKRSTRSRHVEKDNSTNEMAVAPRTTRGSKAVKVIMDTSASLSVETSTKLTETHVATSSPKGAAKPSSFSISDLLSVGDNARKEGIETDEQTTTAQKPVVMNGEIDDDAI